MGEMHGRGRGPNETEVNDHGERELKVFSGRTRHLGQSGRPVRAQADLRVHPDGLDQARSASHPRQWVGGRYFRLIG